ncbi:MAG: hypothetical protein OXT68_03515 [Chloroflexota bacterium]|nr:hypothetical protein [Chloroflexota bacterium]
MRLRHRGSTVYSQLQALIKLAYKSVSWAIPGGVLAAIFSFLPQFMLSTDVTIPTPFPNISDASVAAYDGLLVAILTVTGLFLSLYFTNFNTVIGTLYVEVPENIRNLLIHEPLNRVATLLLTNLIVFTLMTLGGAVVFSVRPLISMVVVLIVGILAIPMFVFVGRRTLFFFNPTYLVTTVIENLEKGSHDAVSTSFAGLDTAIQDFRMRVTHEEAQKLKSIGRIVVEKQNLRRDSVIPLISVSLGFLAEYVRRKRRIPIDSAWYAKRDRHRNWYLANPTEVQLALGTYTGLRPEQSPDFDWLEETLLTFFEDVFQSVVRESDFLVASEIVRTSHIAFNELGAEHHIEIAARSVLALYRSLYTCLIAQESTLSRTERLEQLQLISDLSFLPITILLSFFERLRNLSISCLTDEVKQIDWQDEKDLYVRNLPTFILSDLNRLRSKIKFELETQGDVVSAPWYICQLAVQPVAESLKKQLTALKELGRHYYINDSNNLINSELNHAATLLVISGLEYLHKLEFHSQSLFNVMRDIEDHRILTELPFAEIDPQSTVQEIVSLKRMLIMNLARCIPKLVVSDFFTAGDTPDLLGQAVRTLGEEYFNALRSGDGELAAIIFQSYFQGALATKDAVAMETADWQPPQNIRFTVEPISDLLALSGYAYLFSEFHQDSSLWDSCTNIWSQNLVNTGMYESLAMMMQLVALSKRSLMLVVLSHTRDSWRQKFQHVLKELPLLPLDKNGGRMAFHIFVRRHPSLCIRTVAPREDFASMPFEPDDIFIEMYLAEKLQFLKSDWRRLRDIRQSIENQRELEAQYGFQPEDFEDIADAD